MHRQPRTERIRPQPGGPFRPVSQARQGAVRSDGHLGGGLVVRSRVYLAPGAQWEEAARAHRELLGDAMPANTMLFVHALIGDGLLVEVELEAVTAPAGSGDGVGRSHP